MSTAAHRYVAVVLADPTLRLGSTARLLLRELADHANAEGVAWPGVERLALCLGVHVDTVGRAIRRLVELGLIAVETGGGRSRTNRYRFPVQELDQLSTSPAPARGFVERKPPRQRRETPAPASGNPRASAGGTIKEPLYEPRAVTVRPDMQAAVIGAAASMRAQYDPTAPAFTDAAGALEWARRRSGRT